MGTLPIKARPQPLDLWEWSWDISRFYDHDREFGWSSDQYLLPRHAFAKKCIYWHFSLCFFHHQFIQNPFPRFYLETITIKKPSTLAFAFFLFCSWAYLLE